MGIESLLPAVSTSRSHNRKRSTDPSVATDQAGALLLAQHTSARPSARCPPFRPGQQRRQAVDDDLESCVCVCVRRGAGIEAETSPKRLEC